MIHFIKQKIFNLINKMGYDLAKIDVHDNISVMTGDVADANKVLFFAKSNKLPYLCYVPIEFLRGHVMSFNFDDLNHPFVIAVKKAINQNNKKPTIKEVLSKYYSTVQPDNAAEVLGLEPKEAPELSKKEPWAVTHPWENRTIENIEKQRPDNTRKENKKYGENIGLDEGWHLFGPVSENKLNLETQRLDNVLESIRNQGYRIPDNENNITGAVLINEKNQCRWVVYDGQHRVSVLTGLGYQKVPILIKQVVERKDVDKWPGVVSKDFTSANALKVFDRVFNEKSSPSMDDFPE